MGEEKQYVSDYIGEDYLDWSDGDLIFITYQTGHGKSFFVRDVLANHCKSNNKKMIIFSNRNELKKQYLKHLGDDFSDLIDVLNYQKLEHCIVNNINLNLEKYDFVIADECHTFLTDSSFNKNTDLSMNRIVGLKKAVKIFISATGTILYDYLRSKYKYQFKKNNQKFIKYPQRQFKNSYNHIEELYFYNQNQDVQQFIEQNYPEQDVKVLWFFHEARAAKKMSDIYENSSFICSEHNYRYKKYITDDCISDKDDGDTSFNSKYLFATKTIDNGIDIKDRNLKIIVCEQFDYDTMIQCIGRKRILDKDDKFILLLKNHKDIKLESHLEHCEDKIELVKMTLEKRWDELDKVVGRYGEYGRGIIYYEQSNGNYIRKYNELRYAKTIYDKWLMEKILSFASKYPSKRSSAYMNYINKDMNKKGILLEEVEKRNELELYLKSMEDQYLLTPNDRKILIEKIGVKGTKGKLVKRIDTINSILNEDNSAFTIIECKTSRMEDGSKKVYNSAWKIIRRIDEEMVFQ